MNHCPTLFLPSNASQNMLSLAQDYSSVYWLPICQKFTAKLASSLISKKHMVPVSRQSLLRNSTNWIRNVTLKNSMNLLLLHNLRNQMHCFLKNASKKRNLGDITSILNPACSLLKASPANVSNRQKWTNIWILSSFLICCMSMRANSSLCLCLKVKYLSPNNYLCLRKKHC